MMDARRIGSLLASALVLPLLLSTSCTTPRTEVVVQVATDLDWGAGATVQSLHVVVRSDGPTGTLRDERTIVLGNGAGAQALPATFGVVPLGGDSTRTVWIEVDACAGPQGCTGTPVTLQRAVVGFAPQSTVLLQMFLAASCRDVTCTMLDQTCDPATQHCVDAHRDATTLPPYTPDAAASGPEAATDIARPDTTDIVIPDEPDVIDVADVADASMLPDVPIVPDARPDGGDAGVPPATGIATGDYASCRWHLDGTASCWGANHNGELGRGVIDVDFATAGPASAPPGLYRQIDLGSDFACGLTPEGSVYCWGANYIGQLGRDTGGSADPVPQRVGTLTGVLEVGTGDDYACARLAGGTIWCWGNNSSGQLGTGSTGGSSTTPSQVMGITDAISLTTGGDHACALRATGGVVCWGDNTAGEIGDGTIGGTMPLAKPVVALSNVVEVHAGGGHTCARVTGDVVMCWGENSSYQLGDGTNVNQPSPVEATGANGAVELSTGSDFSCAVMPGGSVLCWGSNFEGQLGTGDYDTHTTIQTVVGVSGATMIDSGRGFTCVVQIDDTVHCWGNNWRGQLGNGMFGEYVTTPGPIPSAPTGIDVIAAGDTATCLQLNTSEVQCVGSGATATLGVVDVPTKIPGVYSFGGLTVGSGHGCARDMAGTGRCWGANNAGQLGDGSMTPSGSGVFISGGFSWDTLSAGGEFTCGVATGRVPYCWGDDTYGQLGIGSTGTTKANPAVVMALTNVTSISAGTRHACAVNTNGLIWCWGSNAHGALGDGTNTDSNVPVAVMGLTAPMVEVDAGDDFTCARDNVGAISCWGYNYDGELGTGTMIDSLVAKPVSLPSPAVAITAGGAHACAIVMDGSVYCWGANDNGQLGRGDLLMTLLPKLIAGFGTVAQIVAGMDHTCARAANGTVLCTGWDLDREFGAVTTPGIATPQLVLGMP